jgi:hypothetical protein
MTKHNSDRYQRAARKLFCTDLEEEIKPYLERMQGHVKALCEKHGFIYPGDRSGRGVKGVRPNIAYAVHFMIKGYTAFGAAYNYMEEQEGKAVLPLPVRKVKDGLGAV